MVRRFEQSAWIDEVSSRAGFSATLSVRLAVAVGASPGKLKLRAARRILRVAVVVALGLGGPLAGARAATINVNTTSDVLAAGGSCSLREAINDVDGQSPAGDCTPADPSLNTIVLPAGDYRLTLTGPGSPNATGELYVAGSTNGALTITGAGAGSTTIDASGIDDRALVISGPAVELQNLTITHGRAPSDDPNVSGIFTSSGGGIWASSALTLDGVQVADNKAADGASGSGTGGFGGGIFAESSVVIENSTISDNAAGAGGSGAEGSSDSTGRQGGPGGAGGGVYLYCACSVRVQNSTISDNAAGAGGAGGLGGANGGTGGPGGVGGLGGGILADGVITQGSTFSGNLAGAGGAGGSGNGLGAQGGFGGSGGGAGALSVQSITALNSTFADNHAGAGGAGGTGGRGGIGGGAGNGGDGGTGGFAGGIFSNNFSPSTLTNVTMSGSAVGAGGAAGDAGAGGGGQFGSAGASGTLADIDSEGSGSAELVMQNSITTASTGSSACRNVTDGGHNLAPDGCVAGSTGVDPKLGPLGDNGGATQTMALLPGSPAIDALPASGANCPPTDQRGVGRPQGAACDIGAFEFSPPVVSTGAATNVAQTSATLNGTVTAYESAATVQFQIGTSAAYGTTTPPQQFGNLTPLPVTAPVSGLLPATTYHYRELATSIEGTSFGADQTFTTPPATGGTGGAGGSRSPTGGPPHAPKLHKHINHKTRSVTFTFSDSGTTGLQCALLNSNPTHRRHAKKPKPRYAACRSPKTYKHLAKGSYEFYVRGVDQAGAGSPTTFKFKI